MVSGMFPPMRTGTSFYTQNLAQTLQSRGHHVTIVTLGETYSRRTEGGLDVYRLPAIRLPLKGFFKHFRLCSANPSNWSRLMRIARDAHADVIFLVNHYLDIAFPTAWTATRLRIPLICSVGTQLQSLNPRRHRVLNILDWLICGRLVFPFCDRVVAWDTQIRQYLSDVHGKSVIRNTVIVNYGVNGNVQELLSHRKNYSFNGVLLGVGAVSEQRSFVPLVKAFAMLSDEFPHLRLRIVGHVYYDEAIRVAKELGVNERTEFLGELPHDKVVKEMLAADVHFSSLTAKYTGLGTATIEAMFLGVPSVVNTPLNLIGTGSLIDGANLVHLLNCDPDNIAKKIRPLLREELLRQEVGIGGREFVKKHLDWDLVAEQMIEVLSDCICRGRKT